MIFKKNLDVQFTKASRDAAKHRKTFDGLSRRHSEQSGVLDEKLDALMKIVAAHIRGESKDASAVKRQWPNVMEDYQKEMDVSDAIEAAMMDTIIKTSAANKKVFRIIRQRMEVLLAQS